MPAAAVRSAPRKSIASANLERRARPAPSSSIDAVSVPRRTCRRDRRRCRAGRTRLTCATGTSCSSTSQTGRPLDSWRFWIVGQLNGRRRADCGGARAVGRLGASGAEINATDARDGRHVAR